MNGVLGTLPAEPDQQNEDFAAVAPGAAVLLDGAGVAGAETGCVHGIAWFSSTLGGLLLGNIAGDPARPLADCLADAIRSVRSLHEDTCDLTYRASPTSTVVAVRVGGEGWSTSSSATRPSSSPVRTGRRPLSPTTAWTRSGSNFARRSTDCPPARPSTLPPWPSTATT